MQDTWASKPTTAGLISTHQGWGMASDTVHRRHRNCGFSVTAVGCLQRCLARGHSRCALPLALRPAHGATHHAPLEVHWGKLPTGPSASAAAIGQVSPSTTRRGRYRQHISLPGRRIRQCTIKQPGWLREPGLGRRPWRCSRRGRLPATSAPPPSCLPAVLQRQRKRLLAASFLPREARCQPRSST